MQYESPNVLNMSTDILSPYLKYALDYKIYKCGVWVARLLFSHLKPGGFETVLLILVIASLTHDRKLGHQLRAFSKWHALGTMFP